MTCLLGLGLGLGLERYIPQSFLRSYSPVFTRSSLYTLVILVEAVYLNSRKPKIYDSSRLLDKNKTNDDSDCKQNKNKTMTLLVLKAVIKAGRSSRRTHAEASLVPGSYSVQILRKQAQRGGPWASGIEKCLVCWVANLSPPPHLPACVNCKVRTLSP
jgi:hypothetical protein